MAKQDLVVKLLLDSGAFGNDLRMAEKKAQDFKNNLQGAGKSAGEFSKAIGLSTGALGKLGGILGGAGVVIGGIEAFKSVMESTHTTAKEFQSTISGFQGVLNTFQSSIARFDFSAFSGGISSIIDQFKAFKSAKDSAMEVSKSNVAYNILSKGYNADINRFEVYYNQAQTKEDKIKARDEAQQVLDLWNKRLTNYRKQVNIAIQQELLAGTALSDAEFKRFQKDVTPEFVDEQINLWSEKQLDQNQRISEKKQYEKFNKELTRLNNEINSYSKGGSVSAPQTYFDNLKKRDELVKDNLGLIIRNKLFEIPQDVINSIQSQIVELDNFQNEVSSASNKVEGWNKSIAEDEKKTEPLEGSISKLQEKIKEQQKVVNEQTIAGTKEWEDAVAVLYQYQKELENIQEQYKKLDPNYISDVKLDAEAGSLECLQEQIKIQKNIVDKTQAGTKEWEDAVAVLYKYEAELKAIQKLMDDNDPNKKEPSLTYTGTIANLQELIAIKSTERDNLEVGSKAWMDATEVLKSYNVELKCLLDYQAELEGSNVVDRFENLNVALSSTNSLLNGVSGLLNTIDSESAKMASNVIGVFSSITDGIMNFIQVQQAAAAATGVSSAAAMPFPYNLAAIASVMGTVLSVFANIKSMVSGKFAEGGIVGGTSFTGDKLFAMVNSGEMILNKRQQNNLANMLGNGGQVEFVISGDSLVGVLNNKHNKRNLTR